MNPSVYTTCHVHYVQRRSGSSCPHLVPWQFPVLAAVLAGPLVFDDCEGRDASQAEVHVLLRWTVRTTRRCATAAARCAPVTQRRAAMGGVGDANMVGVE